MYIIIHYDLNIFSHCNSRNFFGTTTLSPAACWTGKHRRLDAQKAMEVAIKNDVVICGLPNGIDDQNDRWD